MRLSEYRAHAELRALLRPDTLASLPMLPVATGGAYAASRWMTDGETVWKEDGELTARRVRPYLLLRAAAKRAEREALALA